MTKIEGSIMTLHKVLTKNSKTQQLQSSDKAICFASLIMLLESHNLKPTM